MISTRNTQKKLFRIPHSAFRTPNFYPTFVHQKKQTAPAALFLKTTFPSCENNG